VAGTPDASTWYYLWLIQRPDTGVVDALFSESASAPTMPSGYTRKRLIGAVLTDGSANITEFVVLETAGGGIEYLHKGVIVAYDSTVGTTASLISVRVPALPVRALVQGASSKASAAVSVYLSSPSVNDETASASAGRHTTGGRSAAANGVGDFDTRIYTTTQQIRARSDNASTALSMGTRGWEWSRR
jgi:hypothetical protein